MSRFHLRLDLAFPLLLVAVLCACAGCDANNDAITTYRAPKEPTPAPEAQMAALKTAAPATVHWTAPAGWEEQPASGFRKGSFLVRGPDGKTADVSIISFPEAAGGLLANVNRWRNQLKLPPVATEAEAGSALSAGEREMFFVNVASTEPITPEGAKSRILGGIFPLKGETWFFKMMGPDELVAGQRDAFMQFLQSVHLAESAPTTAAGGGSTNAPTAPPMQAAAETPLHFTLPPGWQEKPLTPMRAASFNATAPNGQAVDISVVSLGGMAGGKLANINRWRDQIKLPPIDDAGLAQVIEHVSANGHDFLLVDLESAEAIGQPPEKQRIIAAILDAKERAWFIKMTGEEAAVASQKSAFLDFLRSLRIPASGNE